MGAIPSAPGHPFPMHFYTDKNGLTVAGLATDETAVDRELKLLDRGLFLTKEVDRRYGSYVWRVFHWAGDDHPARWCCDWRDDFGLPLPLSMNLVEKVKDVEGRRAKLENIERANAAIGERADAEMQEAAEEAARDVAKHSAPGHAALLPRSPSLKRARERHRAKGGRL
jgi:hypothetical protein